ncbi:MAG: hypothetical protein QXM86_03630 [Candidatus Bathyarchaeia archaeon]
MEIENIEISISAIAIAVIILLASAGTAYAVLTYIYRIHSIGTVQTIGVQIKDDQGNIVTHIDWGTLTPNSTIDFHCFAINNGTVPITLTLTTENWNPIEAINYISLSWDYLGDTINPGQSHPIIFTLTVSESIAGISSFSFDIIITAQEV